MNVSVLLCEHLCMWIGVCVFVYVPIVPFPRQVEVGEGLCCGNGPVRGGSLAWWNFHRFGNRNGASEGDPMPGLPLPQGMLLHCEPQFPFLVQSVTLSHLHKHRQSCVWAPKCWALQGRSLPGGRQGVAAQK